MLSLSLVVILGWINYAAVHDVSVGIFYLIPVSLGSWFLGSIVARIGVYFFTATVWLGVDVYSGQAGVPSAASYRNALVGFAFLIVFGLILGGLRKAYSHQKELARTDYLTQLANARSFYEAAELEIGRLRRYEHPFTLAYIDIDDFKAINDEHGHAEGNRLLKTLGEAAKRNLRETDLVARLGGDEFALLLPETDTGAAEVAIEKLRHFLLDEMRNHGWAATFSIGVVTCNVAPESVTDVLKLGDSLAYEAKNSGKDTVRYDVIGQ
ncbi:MAG: GGDEF domain-containing protein [Acidobacteriota bacterium]